MDFSHRFDKRAEAYSKYRPDYPLGILDFLKSKSGFTDKAIVADIGSGTGLLTRLFLQNGNTVFAVEPNDQMRQLAEQNLSVFSTLVSVKGRAEHTTLKDASVDIVTAGQALHWFDLKLSVMEFARILRPASHVLVVHNERDKHDPVMQDYQAIVAKHQTDRAAVPEVSDDVLSRLFKGGLFKKVVIPNQQFLDQEGLLGRFASASYMPNVQDDERFNTLKKDVSRLFETWEKSGKVRLLYETVICLGAVRRNPD